MITITPAAASFATPYSANDIVGGVNTVINFTGPGDELSLLTSLVVIDKAKQKAQMDLYFFDSLPTVSADNAAFDMDDANSLKHIGTVSIAAADYVDSASNSSASKNGISMKIPSGDAGQTIYCVAVTRGTPTYGSASDLVIRLGFFFKGD